MVPTAPFIAFEGIDKSGKGTQSRIAAERLKGAWGTVVHFSEPNDRESLIGRHIRKILKREEPMPPMMDLQRLYVLDRAQDTVSTVLPALARGVPVVAERFALSTIAYGMLNGSMEQFVALHREVLGPWLRWPDHTIIIDISAELAMERLSREQATPQYFEKLERLQQARANYNVLARLSSGWAPAMLVTVVDGEGTPDEVSERIASVLAPYLL